MSLLREAFSIFALVNAVAWGGLAAVWAWRPAWAQRLPLQLGTHERYLKAASTWARLAGALAGFWTVAAALYLITGGSTPAAVIVLFTMASAFLIIAILAAASVYRVLKPPRLPSAAEGGQQPL